MVLLENLTKCEFDLLLNEGTANKENSIRFQFQLLRRPRLVTCYEGKSICTQHSDTKASLYYLTTPYEPVRQEQVHAALNLRI